MQKPFGELIKYSFLELTIVSLAILAIRKHLCLSCWQEQVFLTLSAVEGAAFAALRWRLNTVFSTVNPSNMLPMATLFLYVACAVLCQQLRLGVAEHGRTPGVILLILGVGLTIWTYFAIPYLWEMLGIHSTSKPKRTYFIPAPVIAAPFYILRYPNIMGRLFFLLGLPLAFGSWLPLAALPGILVMIRWQINKEELSRVSQFGDIYTQYRQRSWYVIPYIY